MSRISIADHSDIPALEKMVNNSYRGEGSKKGWTTEADYIGGIRANAKMLEEMIDTPGAVILKASDDENNLEGCVYLEPEGRKLYLGLLTVSPEIQARGLGKLLLHESEKFAEQQGLDVIYMNVLSIRTELIEWYERRGYQKTGEIKPFSVNNDLIIPKRDLELLVLEKAI